MRSYMGQQEDGMSDGLYTYKHHRERGADIHTIFVKKSKFRILLSFIGTTFLLVSVCCALLSKVLFFEIALKTVAVSFHLLVCSRAGHVNYKRHNSIETIQLCGYAGFHVASFL